MIGKINFNVVANNKTDNIEAKDVLYVPGITTDLLSVSRIVKNGHIVTFNANGCKVTDARGDIIFATAKKKEFTS